MTADNEILAITMYLILGVLPGTFIGAFTVRKNFFKGEFLLFIFRLTLVVYFLLQLVVPYILLDLFSTLPKVICRSHMRFGICLLILVLLFITEQ